MPEQPPEPEPSPESSSEREPEPGPSPEPEPAAGLPAEDPAARVLCDVRALAGEPPAPRGILWKLAEPGRQLDANVVRLPAGEHIAAHAEPDLDVMVLVVAGGGTMDTPGGALALAEGTMLWLPHGSKRSITAGPDGLAYVTVHKRRPGMQIRRRADVLPAAHDG